MSTQGGGRDPIERLAEEFAERHRRGEQPSVSEYTQKYPDLAEQIRELFPALLIMEELGSVSGEARLGLPPRSAGLTSVVLGEYRLLREVGRGGMGIVFEAVQEPLGRHVALKVLAFHSSTSSVYRERFRRETQAAARLHHTNIVPVFGVGEHEGIHYYAMQFIPGLGLDAVLREVKRLKQEEAIGRVDEGEFSVTRAALNLLTGAHLGSTSTGLRPGAGSNPVQETLPQLLAASAPQSTEILSADSRQSLLVTESQGQYFRAVGRICLQVAEALSYAHHHGIVHRDIKPSNLLLDGEGIVWVTDFGLAKAEDSEDLTNTGDIIGTLRYMPPERLQGVSDARGDVYGLGATLYEMLTLRPPFADNDRSQLMHRLTSEDPPRPATLNPAIPRDLETIVLKAMAREPGQRYATARSMADDLRCFLEDRPIRARRVSRLEHAWRWARRNPGLAGACGLALLALVAVAGLSTALTVRELRITQMLQAKQDLLQAAQDSTLKALRENQQVAASLTLDKSRELCEEGDASLGLLWLAHCLDLATQAQADDLQQAIRINLAVWRQHTGVLHDMLPHAAPVSALAVSPDARLVAAAGMDGSVHLWDLRCGKPVAASWKQQGSTRAVAFSPNGKLLASASGDEKGGEIWLREVPSGRPLFATPLSLAAEVRALAFSPDGKKLVTGDVGGAIRFWETATGKPLLKTPLYHGEHQQIQAVAFSPDGAWVATGSVDHTACLWDAHTNTLVRQLPKHRGEVWAVAFRPDGKLLVTGTLNGEVKGWDVSTGRMVPQSELRHPGSVRALAFRPDGKRLLLALADGTIRFLDPDSWEPAGTPLKERTATRTAVFSPDGRQVISGAYDGIVRIWQLAPSDPVVRTLTASGSPLCAAFRADGQMLATGQDDRTAWLWDVASGKPLHGRPLVLEGLVAAVAFSSDGRWVLTGSDDKKVRLWEVSTGKLQGPPLPHKESLLAAAFRPDNQVIGTSDSDGRLYLWKMAGGKPLLLDFLPAQKTVSVLAFSPDSQVLLAGNREDSLRLYHAATLEQLGSILHLPGGCYAAAFSRDGRRILTGSGDGSAQLWEAGTGRHLGPGLVHNETVTAVAFSPADDLLLTGSRHGHVRLWHAPTGKAVGPKLDLPTWPDAVAFTPDGRLILASGGGALLTQRYPGSIPGAGSQVTLWVQVLTGMELGEDGAFRMLELSEWQQRRQRLQECGGPPSLGD